MTGIQVEVSGDVCSGCPQSVLLKLPGYFAMVVGPEE